MSYFSLPCANPNYEMVAIPAFEDNYIWLYINKKTATAIVVDPGDGMAALGVVVSYNVQISAILITHHHSDHSAGIYKLVHWLCGEDNTLTDLIPVYGPKREWIPQVTHKLSDGDVVSIPDFDPFTILSIPGHTKGHIAYHSTYAGTLFCGDTLFTGGCGRLFEGTPAKLFNSLQKINALPLETLIYCGHEYTEKNLAFALTVEPNNVDLQERYKAVCALRKKKQPTVPSTLLTEQQTNPFLRTRSKEIVAHVSQALGRSDLSEVEIFATLRSWKDNF
jgi:hydroxyacylglutathione hydrolase